MPVPIAAVARMPTGRLVIRRGRPGPVTGDSPVARVAAVPPPFKLGFKFPVSQREWPLGNLRAGCVGPAGPVGSSGLPTPAPGRTLPSVSPSASRPCCSSFPKARRRADPCHWQQVASAARLPCHGGHSNPTWRMPRPPARRGKRRRATRHACTGAQAARAAVAWATGHWHTASATPAVALSCRPLSQTGTIPAAASATSGVHPRVSSLTRRTIHLEPQPEPEAHWQAQNITAWERRKRIFECD